MRDGGLARKNRGTSFVTGCDGAFLVPGASRPQGCGGMETWGSNFMTRTSLLILLSTILYSCGRQPPATAAGARAVPEPTPSVCGGKSLRVHFYNVSQALSALVELPDGRKILVDAGDTTVREGCGEDCGVAHKHLMDKLTSDLAGGSIDLMWITHQHSDHMGGAVDILKHFKVTSYADNGRDEEVSEIKAVRAQLKSEHIKPTVVEPGHEQISWQNSGDVRLTGIAPF